MSRIAALVGITLLFSAAVMCSALAEPVLMLNEPRDIEMARGSCQWAEGEIKNDQYLIKAFQCDKSELCERAIEINAACKVGGPVAEVHGFHGKLLAKFASNPQCAITIVRLTENNTFAAYKQASWELNLGFAPGAAKQQWSLWPVKSGQVQGGALEGEGDVDKIARDVCTIVAGKGAKILN